jgi:hypothetical protein
MITWRAAGTFEHIVYRWAIQNGWNCGHWHGSFADATTCFEEKMKP